MNHAERGDGGFTLVELLVVLVIMPMIVGAIAAAIIATQGNSGSTQATLTDSANAQITSEYYPRDVQGAQYVTTTANVPTPYTVQSPQVCPNTSLTNTTLVLGLYRPATNSTATSVSYWTGSTSATPPILELVRDYCTVSSSYTSTGSSEVVMSDDISSATATLLPSQFATAVPLGWTPTSASTTLTSDADLPSGTLIVGSTTGFDIGLPLSVVTSAGMQSVTCTGSTDATFTGCSGGSATASTGSPVFQPDSISGINLSVTEVASGYTFSLSASPPLWGQTSLLTGP